MGQMLLLLLHIFQVKIEVHVTGQISDNSAKISRLNQDKKRERVGAAARPKVCLVVLISLAGARRLPEKQRRR